MKCQLWIVMMISRYCSRRITSCVLMLQCALLIYILYNYEVRHFSFSTRSGKNKVKHLQSIIFLKFFLGNSLFLLVLAIFYQAVGLINLLHKQVLNSCLLFLSYPGFRIWNQNHWLSHWSSSRILILDNKWLIDKLKRNEMWWLLWLDFSSITQIV